jgi:serine protease AprX
LAGFISLVLVVPARAQYPTPDKFDEVVREAVAAGKSVQAIVRFRDEAARARAAETIAHGGGRVRRALTGVNALNVAIDATAAEQLSADGGTLAISVDATVRSTAAGPFPKASRASDADTEWEQPLHASRRVSIAVVDSGVQPHADLPGSRIRKFVDFVNGRTKPYDDFGHGTHVAGIAAGSGLASSFLEAPYVGAAPDVDIVALKVLDAEGAGRTSDVIAALEWIARNHVTYNIRVVNLSLGHPVYEPAATDPLVRAAEALVQRGLVVVASAGNLGIDPTDHLPGNGGITSPANGPRIIAVGAVDNKGTHIRSDDAVAAYSSRGPTRFDLIVKPDIVASGHRVVSLAARQSRLYQRYPELRVAAAPFDAPRYMVLSGTSMASPAVAGTAAAMLEANPALSVSTVRALLEFTAQRLEGTDVLTQGAGQLNTVGAVRLARLVKPAIARGQIWLTSQGSVPQAFDMMFGEPVTWAKNIVWGERVLLGDAAYVHLAAWDDNIVWGQDLDNIVWGQCGDNGCDNIVWGQCDAAGCDNIVWGQTDNIVWGQRLENIVWGECGDVGCANIVWGQDGTNIVWGQTADNIVWGQCGGAACDNIVWGQDGGALAYWANNTVWGFWDATVDWSTVSRVNEDNIVWGEDNIVWGEMTVLTFGGQQ